MKIIHSRIKATDKELSGSELLVWYLSVIQWKRLGYTTKIYVDDYNLQYIKDKKLYELYDEVDSEFFNDEDGFFVSNDIDKEHFWASSKIFLLENETESCIVTDHDFIPFKEIPTDKDVVVYHREKLNIFSYYNNEAYPLNYDKNNYSIPEWFTFEVRPINASVCYIKNQEVKKQYIEEAYKYISGNHEDYSNSNPDMIYIEQRFLSELCNHLNVEITTLIDLKKETTINKNYFHLHFHKNVDTEMTNGKPVTNNLWHIFLLQVISKKNPELYDYIINLEQFSEDKQYIEENGFDSYKIPFPLRLPNWEV